MHAVGSGALTRLAAEAINRAETYLVHAQDGDGFWRDYVLPPGAGEAWVTAVVLYALERYPRPSRATLARIERGLGAISRSFTAEGWGYNRVTPPDADSTAWCVLAASASASLSSSRLRACLAAFVDDDGYARTYREMPNRIEWQHAHADVTPLLGLALQACGAEHHLVERMRSALLRARQAGGTWQCYWWSTPSYAGSWAMKFLRASGGLPPGLADEVNHALNLAEPTNDFDLAHRLMAALHLGSHPKLYELFDRLLENQLPNGTWKPSRVLRLPSGLDTSTLATTTDDRGVATDGPSTQMSSGETQTDPAYDRSYADCRGIMTTAMALLALKSILRYLESQR